MKRILIVGDLFPTKINIDLFASGSVESLFDKSILDLFEKADISVCNLEGALTKYKDSAIKLGPRMKADPSVLNTYKKLGFSLMATANNHITDYRHQGYLDTKKALEDYGFTFIGSGVNETEIRKSITYNLDGVKVCIYNVAETMFNIPTATTAGVHLYDEYRVCKEIEALKKGCDRVIVIYHGGTEFFPYPTPELKKRFHRMADSGADIVLAQHTHCIGCEEEYNGSYLLYGQGNFLLGSVGDKEGLAIEILFDGPSFKVIKHMVVNTGGHVEYVPSPDFSDFEERGNHIADDDYLITKFKDFTLTQKGVKTSQFAKKRSYDKLLKKILPDRLYGRFKEKYRTVHFTRSQLLRILYTVQSEQQRETALYMVKKELEIMDKTKN